MAQNQKPTSILESLGEEVIVIIAPVSICMFVVVILVCILNTDYSSSSSITTIVTIAYTETSSDSSWDKFMGALLNSLAFVAVVTVSTFVLVLLFYFRCTGFLKFYLGLSSFIVLGFMGGEIAVVLIEDYSIPIDCITFLVALFNFAVVGVFAVFMSKMAILVTQGYLVFIGVLVAYWFTLLPEWTTWVLLVAMALYDLAAVLLPIGPLRLLVELAMSRDEDIPALVYEARPVTPHDSGSSSDVPQRRTWREGRNAGHDLVESSNAGSHYYVNVLGSDRISGTSVAVGSNHHETRLVRAEEGRVSDREAELAAPLIDNRVTQLDGRQNVVPNESFILEGIGLGSSSAIKLGLGDFIFYSVLVGRAAMYDLMTVYASYLAIIAGLGITLVLLAFYQKALPALPVSVALGVLFYFLTRLLLEDFVVQCCTNLLMF
ncbi:presenilin-like protein At2g29900 [Carica papaya]|uniref:presenilin-like protein At2g29900 n=1 Tax=Carica papaya TaxID=3649 RepID=UPI000B8CC129|nr:presenilin-like protein At2g29900 [Carica papaya]